MEANTYRVLERIAVALEAIANSQKPGTLSHTTHPQKAIQQELDFTDEVALIEAQADVEQTKHRHYNGRTYKGRYTGRISVYDTHSGKAAIYDGLKEAAEANGWTMGGAISNAARSHKLYKKRFIVSQMDRKE